jgi:hypothetical protein
LKKNDYQDVKSLVDENEKEIEKKKEKENILEENDINSEGHSNPSSNFSFLFTDESGDINAEGYSNPSNSGDESGDESGNELGESDSSRGKIYIYLVVE